MGLFTTESESDLPNVWMHGIRKLRADEVPSAYYIDEPLRHPLPDIFGIVGSVLVVSKKLKRILEELDPSLHQYFPIKIVQANGEDVLGEYFILHVTASKETVITDQPAVETIRYKDIEMKSLNTMMLELNPLKVNHDSVQEGAHFWHSKNFPSYYFINENLRNRMKNEKVSFFQTYATQHVCE